MGDFNEITRMGEQHGGNEQSAIQMENFRTCLSDCGLADLGFSGYPFTWNNRREGADNIQVRLDRATCNNGLANLFPATSVEHITTEETDHLVLLVKVVAEADVPRRNMDRGFRFEEMWTKHDVYEEMVRHSWETEDQGDRGLNALWHRLKRVTGNMKSWSREVFGLVRREIHRLKDQLEYAREAALVSNTSMEIREIEQKLHEIYEQEEIMYRQCSRAK
jgi:hypothetical protein